MDPLVLLRDARAAGLAVTADDDGQVVVRGPLRLAALAEAVLAEKAAVLVALRAEAGTFPGGGGLLRCVPHEHRCPSCPRQFKCTAPSCAGVAIRCVCCELDGRRARQEA